jgi:RimJ/RimL family protein N-acetyltransferase
MFTSLESDRLNFRQPRASDFAPLLETFRDPLTISVYGEMSGTDVWLRFASGLGHWQLQGFGPFALEHKATGEYVGVCGLYYPEGWQDIEIGYNVAPKFRRQGFAAEAVRRVRAHGYVDRGIARLVSYISPSNLASQAVANTVGAIAEGEFDMAGKPHIIFVHPKS